SDAELRIMTGYGREEFGILYRAFAERWELVEREEIERRRQYRLERAGKGGPRPAADAYGDYVRNIPLIRDEPLRASEPGNRTAEKFAASGGVMPSHRNSASTYRGGGITKQGSVWMRNASRHDDTARREDEKDIREDPQAAGRNEGKGRGGAPHAGDNMAHADQRRGVPDAGPPDDGTKV
ncbi:MAG: hypothetical protein J4F28_08830, partial [Nitrosopumilaceae archaeon]|nr:hypothetical protein [Nitrosopumilaceae archaeon]